MQVQHQNVGDYQLITYPNIGSGATGTVYYGVNLLNKTKVAAKQIDTTKITASLAKQIQNQIKNLTQIDSPYIVKLYDYFKCGQYLYLFLEYCEDGDLKAYLDTKKGSGLCQSEALLFMRHIIEGYKELAKKQIIHRDIKPANILLKQGVAKLSDFGFSRVVEDPQISKKMTLLGSPLYTALQILNGEKFKNLCDIWSFGVVFYEMLEGRTPWTGKDLPDLKENIKNRKLQFKNIINPKIKELIKKMLSIDTKNRIGWPEIFQHELFKRIQPIKNNITPEMSFEDVKKNFSDYMQTHMVKAYLRLNMSDVSFKESYEPAKEEIKMIIEGISKEITHKRNIAFMHLYILALYYKNKNDGLISEDVNRCMEFQYGLAMKARNLIYSIGLQYFEAEKAPKHIKEWKIFQKSSNYEELKKILSSDYNVANTLTQSIRKKAEHQAGQGLLPEEAVKYFRCFEKDFDRYFEKVMKQNEKYLSKKVNGVSKLLEFYLKDYINSSSTKLQEYSNLDMGSFYQNNQKKYGLL